MTLWNQPVYVWAIKSGCPRHKNRDISKGLQFHNIGKIGRYSCLGLLQGCRESGGMHLFAVIPSIGKKARIIYFPVWKGIVLVGIKWKGFFKTLFGWLALVSVCLKVLGCRQM